jgi:DNA-binding NtrC family response regulator
LRALLEADGHRMDDAEPEVILTDDFAEAPRFAKTTPTLVLAGAGNIRDAVAAMAQGAYGYIFVPLQPGETEIMVRRAAGAALAAEEPPLRTMAEVEAEHILMTLRRCKNNKAEAARVLGLGRNTLWRKLKQIEQSRHDA